MAVTSRRRARTVALDLLADLLPSLLLFAVASLPLLVVQY